jgi:hypothetical protein
VADPSGAPSKPFGSVYGDRAGSQAWKHLACHVISHIA